MSDTRYFVVGDIHAKAYMVDKIIELIEINDYEKIIFLGDYVDDWDATPEQSYNTLKKLVNLKLSQPDKVILLSGNHCQSYTSAGSFRCSGFNEQTRSLVKDLYKTKLNDEYIFQFAFAKGNYLFTHAGVTNEFYKELKFLIRSYPRYSDLQPLLKSQLQASCISELLNQIFIRGMGDQTYGPFQMFAQVGFARGGRQIPSPIWADKTELTDDPLPKIRQVVGHTPIKTITFYPENTNSPQLIFCDTLSAWHEPYTGLTFPIGDRSILQMTFKKNNTAKIQIISKRDWLWT